MVYSNVNVYTCTCTHIHNSDMRGKYSYYAAMAHGL